MVSPVHVSVGKIKIGNDLPFTLFAGPCQMESEAHAFEMAHALVELCKDLDIPFVYKTSFDKANRTSISGERGVGLEKAIPVFEKIRSKFGCPVMTDVHTESQCSDVASSVDVLQIPAYLCRQTDLLLAAGKTGKVINVKKGQFLAPWDVENIAKKIETTGNKNILLCERGTMFGYNRLVVDMRSFPIMAQTGYPVVFDATHSVQEPGGQGGKSGGKREFAPILARGAAAIGAAAFFMETHEDPDNAPSDGPNMIYLKNMRRVLTELKEVDAFAKKNPVSL
ncbi:3-deoxy-8-phosphooctulonate synthase [Alphaproteobacteria bacterium]|nr:3-deoxy-8-phosphooctulonate synthase [Alphaproteobacteria bacterium]